MLSSWPPQCFPALPSLHQVEEKMAASLPTTDLEHRRRPKPSELLMEESSAESEDGSSPEFTPGELKANT